MFLCLLFLGMLNIAAQQDTVQTVQLKPITLKVARITESQLPLSISHLDLENTQASRQQLSLNEYLVGVPGLFTLNANNFSQDLRVSIRGFGARAAFGIRGIKILVDGIPETTPDGQGQLDNLNLGIIKNIEIIRGPSSTLYGNASGGVISINTMDMLHNNLVKAGLTFGSYTMQKYQVLIGLKRKQTQYIFQGSSTNTTGYREQSGFENYNFNLRMLHAFSEDTKLNIQLNYTDSPFADDAGGLTFDELRADRRQARQQNVDYKTGEAIRQFKIGANFNHQWKALTFNSYGFYSFRDFYGLLPFQFGGIVDLNRNYLGNGSSISHEKKLEKGKNVLQVGYDFASQDDDRRRFWNLQGAQGEMNFDQKESFTSLGFFVLDHFTIGKFLVRAGLRYDMNTMKVNDDYTIDGDDSGNLQLNAVNPSLSVNYRLNAAHNLHTSFSKSFETPALSELSTNPTAEGGFNKNLKAQKAANYEVGYQFEGKKSKVAVSLFYIETTNDLVPFELEEFPDRTFYRNAGSSKRKGIELAYHQKISKNMTLNSSYTYSDFKYGAYQSTAGDFKNKELPGIPKHLASSTLNYQHANGFTVGFQGQYVGVLYANDSNSVATEGYTVFNLNLGYKLAAKKALFSPFLGINNVFNTQYNDNVRINAFGGRYYEPAPGFNIFGGIRVEL